MTEDTEVFLFCSIIPICACAGIFLVYEAAEKKNDV